MAVRPVCGTTPLDCYLHAILSINNYVQLLITDNHTKEHVSPAGYQIIRQPVIQFILLFQPLYVDCTSNITLHCSTYFSYSHCSTFHLCYAIKYVFLGSF